eukprot:scaffold1813_cov129-Isochrysis_galbana.AAC.13
MQSPADDTYARIIPRPRHFLPESAGSALPLVPSLPRRHVLGKCAGFCAEGIGSPSPAKEGGL